MDILRVVVILASLSIGNRASHMEGQIRYKAIELPSIPGQPQTHVAAINNIGQIVGYSFPPDPQSKGPYETTGIYWHGDQTVYLRNGILVFDINNNWQIIGQRWSPPLSVVYGSIKPDGLVKLKLVPNNNSNLFLGMINDHSQMAGFYTAKVAIPCICQNGKRRVLPMPHGWNSGSAVAINEHGDAVGWAQNPHLEGEGFKESLLWQDGQVRVLGVLPGYQASTPAAISDSGEIVGSSWNVDNIGDALMTPYIWRNGQMSPLASRLDSKRISSKPSSINDAGLIVGTAQLSPRNSHACLWEHGVMMDLNDMAVLPSGVVLWSAVGINNIGQIVCDGRVDGQWRAFLLTPVHD